jgi:F0F1-type ATP synthase alpha subunit
LAQEDCRAFELQLYEFLDTSATALVNKLREKRELNDEIRAELRKTLDEFKAKFVADRKAATAGQKAAVKAGA